MKNIKLLITLLFLISLNNFNAQDFVKSTITTQYPTVFKASHKIVIKNAILSDGNYVFNANKKEKVFVTIENGFYTEIYPNNEFVKAKINWVSEYAYKLKIVEVKKARFKYKVGEEFTSEITDITEEKYSYQTKLENGKIYRGKLLKLKEENSRR